MKGGRRRRVRKRGKIQKKERRREGRKVCLDKWSPSYGGLSDSLRKEEG